MTHQKPPKRCGPLMILVMVTVRSMPRVAAEGG
jgi:hypothetical protein